MKFRGRPQGGLHRAAYFVLLAALLSGASLGALHRPHTVLVRRAHYIMGTIFEITAIGRDRAEVVEAIQAAFATIRRADRLLSHYRPESDLMQLNDSAPRRPVQVSAELYQVLRHSLHFAELSGGAFDVTVNPLVELWRQASEQNRLPNAEDLKRVRPLVGSHKIELLPGRRVHFRQDRMQVNLGAIGKGWAVDRALEELRKRGIANAFLSAGTSTIYALGEGPQGGGWSVTIRDPREPETSLTDVQLRDEGLSTSASYELFYEIEGKRYSHIIDPRTGRPVEPMLTATVVAPTATEADALSTAVFVLGLEEGAELLRRLERAGVLMGKNDPALTAIAMAGSRRVFHSPKDLQTHANER